jgi:hypothetical protein
MIIVNESEDQSPPSLKCGDESITMLAARRSDSPVICSPVATTPFGDDSPASNAPGRAPPTCSVIERFVFPGGATREHRHRLIKVCVVALLVVLVQVRPIKAAIWPVRVWGDLGYTYRHEDSDKREHVGRVNVHAATFISEPWIAQVEGRIGLQVRDTDEREIDSSGDLIDGEVRLRLFPRSRFPSELYFQQLDSTTDTTLTGLDRELTRYGIVQMYRTEIGHRFRARYEHTDQTFDALRKTESMLEVDRDVADLLELGYDYSLNGHNIRASTTWHQIDRKDTGNDFERLFATVNHRYRDGNRLTVNNRLTYHDTETQIQRLLDRDFRTTTTRLEFMSYTFWRPQTRKPTLVNGTVRLVDSSSGSGASSTDQQSYFANIGASYDWSRNWRLAGNGSLLHVTGVGNDSAFLSGTATYTSITIPWRGFDYGWFAGPEAIALSDDVGSLFSVGFHAGHTLSRSVPLRNNAFFRFTGRQSGNLIEDTDGRSVQSLLHNVSVEWRKTKKATTASLRLSANDARTYGGGGRQGDEERDFQLVNFQAAVNQNLTRVSSLIGNATIQAIRSEIRRVEGGGDWDPTASVNFAYNNRQLFSVPRLTFRSELRALSDSYFPFLDETQELGERETLVWENRVEYWIGRLYFTLLARASEYKQGDQSLVLFQVRRFFGNF